MPDSEIAAGVNCRLSVSLTRQQYKQLTKVAKTHKVSVAWVIREAIERLLKDDVPLFQARKLSI